MDNWKSIWAVIKGEQLSAEKALNRNAGIGIFLLLVTVMPVLMSKSGKIEFTPFSLLKPGMAVLCCFSWLVARNDEIRRNQLLDIQGKLGLLFILVTAFVFISGFHSISHPAPGAGAFRGGVGYAPGLMGGAFFYFGRHISDFSEAFKIEFSKFNRALLAISIVLEAIVIVKFIEALISIMDRV